LLQVVLTTSPRHPAAGIDTSPHFQFNKQSLQQIATKSLEPGYVFPVAAAAMNMVLMNAASQRHKTTILANNRRSQRSRMISQVFTMLNYSEIGLLRSEQLVMRKND
jgi:hypothetical protein